MIRQGEVHWVRLGRPRRSEPGYLRPCVVVQSDSFNASAISTIVVAAITCTMRLGAAFGNITLRKGEAGLRRKSVVNVSQLSTVDRSMFEGRIGMLSRERLDEVLHGIHVLLRPVEH